MKDVPKSLIAFYDFRFLSFDEVPIALAMFVVLLPFDGRVTARRNLSIHPTNGF